MTESRTLHTCLLLMISGLFFYSCGVARIGTVVSGRSAGETPKTGESLANGSVIQSGKASWYGPDFNGKLTANGETYDMDDLTAAHRTLPFNTVVRIRNQENGKEVDVRINDRGPYIGDRIIDLSRGAAREIDMIGPGLADVELYLLAAGDRPITRSNASSKESFTVQIASFDTHYLAAEESRKISGSEVVKVSIGGKEYYRVYYGSYPTMDDADRGMDEIRKLGLSGFVKQREN